jgi:hypothetical protein
MNYENPAAFRMALERRLLDRSHATGMSLVRLRKAVVFDRLLARLMVVAPGRWVLKGALALDYRLGSGTRTTKDIDLGRQDDEEAATADLLKAQAADLGDFFVFAIEKTDRLDQLQEGAAVRYHADCDVAGRRFDSVTVDVAFGDPLAEPEVLTSPNLLGFAGIEPVHVPAIPLPEHVAEKVHAYARMYGSGGIASTRVKDLIDLVLVAQSTRLHARDLRDALTRTFESRGTQVLPGDLPKPPDGWGIPYRRMASELGLDPDLDVGHAEAARFLNPILAGHTSGSWNPKARRWE